MQQCDGRQQACSVVPSTTADQELVATDARVEFAHGTNPPNQGSLDPWLEPCVLPREREAGRPPLLDLRITSEVGRPPRLISWRRSTMLYDRIFFFKGAPRRHHDDRPAHGPPVLRHSSGPPVQWDDAALEAVGQHPPVGGERGSGEGAFLRSIITRFAPRR